MDYTLANVFNSCQNFVVEKIQFRFLVSNLVENFNNYYYYEYRNAFLFFSFNTKLESTSYQFKITLKKCRKQKKLL